MTLISGNINCFQLFESISQMTDVKPEWCMWLKWMNLQFIRWYIFVSFGNKDKTSTFVMTLSSHHPTFSLAPLFLNLPTIHFAFLPFFNLF